jgi:Ni/Co efflux regulator RcnB
MRKFLISAAIIGLVGGTSLAMAQDHDRQGGGDAPRAGGGEAPHAGGGAPHAGAPGGASRPAGGAPQARGPAPAAPRAQNPAAANGRNATGQREMREHHDTPSAPAATPPAAAPNAVRGNNNAARGNSGPGQNFNRPNSNGPNTNNNAGRGNAGRPDANRPNSNNAARGGGGQRDFSSARNFHQNFNAQRRFHAPAYRQPPGYYARRWTWGQVLPSIFWAQDYWLTDYNSYDLPPPPYGATWVRVGSDALLIDQDSGEIIEVDYGVFY